MVVDPTTGEVQRCFTTADGFRICNFVVIYGKVRRSKSGKWMKFRAFRRAKRKAIKKLKRTHFDLGPQSKPEA